MKSHLTNEPRRGSFKRASILTIALAVLGSMFAIVGMSPANATGTTTGGDCTYEWVREIPQSHGEAKYKKSVTDYKADPQWQKQVRGNIQKLSGGSWVNTGTTFGFEDWERPTWNTDGSFYWESEYDGRAMSGTHGATSVTYTSGGYTYRKAATHFQYAKNGVTRQIVSGSHYEYYLTGGGSSLTNTDANWTRETPGAPWVRFETRTVQDPPIKQGPVRSATEPDRGQYPNVPWTKVPGSEVCPAGQSNYTTNCESITLNAPTGVTPTGSQSRYLIDGVVKAAGTHVVSAGNHTITLEVLVNGAWKKVDEDLVTVEVCPTGGTSRYETSCNTLKLYAATGVLPQGGESRYLLNGVVKAPGTYTLVAGTYELTLEVLVNGTWRQTDKDTVVIEDCKPMPAASGTVDCSGFVINLVNTNGTAEAPFSVVTPTGTTESITVAAGQSVVRTYAVVEDANNTVTVSAPGMQAFTFSFAADCVKTPPPVPPTPPVYDCPPGTTWVQDLNGDGIKQPNECKKPGKAFVEMTTSCKGQVALSMRNKTFGRVSFIMTVRADGAVSAERFVLKAGKSRYVVRSVPNGAHVSVKFKGHPPVKATVPKRCGKPDTGMRLSAKRAANGHDLSSRQVVRRDF